MSQNCLLEAGLDVKYLIMERWRAGILQQMKTRELQAMIPGKKQSKKNNLWGLTVERLLKDNWQEMLNMWLHVSHLLLSSDPHSNWATTDWSETAERSKNITVQKLRFYIKIIK